MSVETKTLTAQRALQVAAPLLGLLAVVYFVDRLYHPQKFRIEDVVVVSHGDYIDRERVKAVAMQAVRGNYFGLNIAQVEARVAQTPWVLDASVRRRWPNLLLVEVRQAQPVARWGSSHWLNADGRIIQRETDAVEIERHLPQLVAPAAHSHATWRLYQRLSRQLAESRLAVQSMRLDELGIWRVRIAARGGAQSQAALILTVHEQQAEARITQFMRILENHLLPLLPQMRGVDLRHPNGFAVAWREPASKVAQSLAQPEN